MVQTAQVAIDRIRTITGDINKAQFTDNEIINWISDSQNRLINRTYSNQEHFAVQSVVGQSNYVLPAGVSGAYFIRQVWYGQYLLTPTTVEEISSMYPANISAQQNSYIIGTPKYYHIDPSQSIGWNIQLFPSPDTADIPITGIKVNVPTAIVAPTDPLSVPDDQIETLVLMCLQRAKEWDMDYEGARYFDQFAEKRMGEDSYNNTAKIIQEYPHVRDLPSDQW